MLVIHPFSFRHYFSSPVILNASSPSLSITPLPLILNHSNVRVVPSAVAHIQIANSESFIHHSVFTVIHNTPTIRFVLKHIAFPSLSIVIQIQHLIVLNSTHLLSIHSQQSVGRSIDFNHSIQRQLHYNRRELLNQSFMAPAQSISYAIPDENPSHPSSVSIHNTLGTSASSPTEPTLHSLLHTPSQMNTIHHSYLITLTFINSFTLHLSSTSHILHAKTKTLINEVNECF